MNKILFTGFEPFGGESINPSWEAVAALPTEIDGVSIVTAKIPVVFGKSADVLLEVLRQEQPCAVICVGQAGGRAAITIERVAINCDDANIDDNAGNRPVDELIARDGPAAYFATLPIKAMVDALRNDGIPAAVSNSAGTYVCNHVMYAALHYAATHKLPLAAGFVHIPYLPLQVKCKAAMPSMSLEMLTAGLVVMAKTIKQGVAKGRK